MMSCQTIYTELAKHTLSLLALTSLGLWQTRYTGDIDNSFGKRDHLYPHYVETVCKGLTKNGLADSNASLGLKDLDVVSAGMIKEIIDTLPELPFDRATIHLKVFNQPADGAAAGTSEFKTIFGEHIRILYINPARCFAHLDDPQALQKLYFIIAHEIAHLVKNHGLYNRKNNLIINDEPDQERKQLLQQQYRELTKSYEFEADEWAVKALFSAQGGIAFCNEALERSGGIDLAPDASHPPFQERIERMLAAQALISALA